jgi:ligand-binding SRPBCC domain-containing protein
MKIYVLEKKLLLPISVNEAWDFFSNPGNLAHITPPRLGFKMTSEAPERIYPGLILTYEVSPYAGIRLEWVTEITQVNKPEFFVDDQRLGPYKFWHHQHMFKEIKGGVEIVDLVHYALPLGPIGEIAHELTVKKQLNEIFEYRGEYLKRKFGEIP